MKRPLLAMTLLLLLAPVSVGLHEPAVEPDQAPLQFDLAEFGTHAAVASTEKFGNPVTKYGVGEGQQSGAYYEHIHGPLVDESSDGNLQLFLAADLRRPTTGPSPVIRIGEAGASGPAGDYLVYLAHLANGSLEYRHGYQGEQHVAVTGPLSDGFYTITIRRNASSNAVEIGVDNSYYVYSTYSFAPAVHHNYALRILDPQTDADVFEVRGWNELPPRPLIEDLANRNALGAANYEGTLACTELFAYGFGDELVRPSWDVTNQTGCQDPQIPAVPRDLVVQPESGVESTALRLNWLFPNEQQYTVGWYHVYYTNGTRVGTGDSVDRTLVDTGLQPSTQYCYYVGSNTNGGESPPSEVTCASTLSEPTGTNSTTASPTNTNPPGGSTPDSDPEPSLEKAWTDTGAVLIIVILGALISIGLGWLKWPAATILAVIGCGTTLAIWLSKNTW